MLPDKLSKLLTAYVDGELHFRHRKAVSRLLRKSSEARKLYRKIKGDSLVLRCLPRHTLQIDLSGTIIDQITKLDLRPGRDLVRRPAARSAGVPAWMGAAAALLLVAVGVGSYFYFAPPEGSNNPPTVADKKTNDPGEQPEPWLSHPVPDPANSDKLPAGGPDDIMGPEAPKSNPNSVFAFPNLKLPQFRAAQTRVPLIFWLRDFEQATAGEQLKHELKKDAAARCDIFCTDTNRGVDRLQAAAKLQGIQVKIDPTAQDRIQRRLKTTFALYVENMTADDLAKLLRQLAGDDKKHGQFLQVVVAPTTAEELAKVFGGPKKDFAPPSQRPVEQGTAGEILHALPTTGVKPSGSRAPERTLVVVPYNPPQATPCKEIKTLLDGYREQRPATMQLLLVLWGNP